MAAADGSGIWWAIWRAAYRMKINKQNNQKHGSGRRAAARHRWRLSGQKSWKNKNNEQQERAEKPAHIALRISIAAAASISANKRRRQRLKGGGWQARQQAGGGGISAAKRKRVRAHIALNAHGISWRKSVAKRRMGIKENISNGVSVNGVMAKARYRRDVGENISHVQAARMATYQGGKHHEK